MDVISLSILLEYLYKKFMVTFVLCLIGAIIRESLNTVKLTKIDIKKLLASVVLSSVIMCAIIDYVTIPFSIYAVVCVIFGIWSQTLIKLVMHTKFMTLVIARLFKKFKDPVIEEVLDTIDELQQSQENDSADKNDKTEENKKADSS